MKTEAEVKRELKLSDALSEDAHDRVSDADASFGLDEFIEVIRETNDEVLQVEELKTHVAELKEDLIRYFTEIVEEYELELKVPAESFHPKEKSSNIQTVFLNKSGIISYNFKDGSVKSHRLSDYQPSELMTIFSVAMPHLREALGAKRKDYEEMSNRLSKIKKYLTFLKEKVKSQKPAAQP